MNNLHLSIQSSLLHLTKNIYSYIHHLKSITQTQPVSQFISQLQQTLPPLKYTLEFNPQLPQIQIKQESHRNSLLQNLNSSFDVQGQLFLDDTRQKSMIKSELDLNLNRSKQKAIRGPRGKYKHYSQQFKRQIVNLVTLQQKSTKLIAQIKRVPIKNINRWVNYGVEKKKGGGRKKLDPNLQITLYKWIIQKKNGTSKIPTPKEIRQKAKQVCQRSEFKASKGWYDKFRKKFGINIMRRQIEMD